MSNNQEFDFGNKSSIDPVRASIWGAIMLWMALGMLAIFGIGLFFVLVVFQ